MFCADFSDVNECLESKHDIMSQHMLVFTGIRTVIEDQNIWESSESELHGWNKHNMFIHTRGSFKC